MLIPYPYILYPKQGLEGKPPEPGPELLSPVEYRNYRYDIGSGALEVPGGPHGLRPRGHDVLDEGDPLTSLEVALNVPPGGAAALPAGEDEVALEQRRLADAGGQVRGHRRRVPGARAPPGPRRRGPGPSPRRSRRSPGTPCPRRRAPSRCP